MVIELGMLKLGGEIMMGILKKIGDYGNFGKWVVLRRII